MAQHVRNPLSTCPCFKSSALFLTLSRLVRAWRCYKESSERGTETIYASVILHNDEEKSANSAVNGTGLKNFFLGNQASRCYSLHTVWPHKEEKSTSFFNAWEAWPLCPSDSSLPLVRKTQVPHDLKPSGSEETVANILCTCGEHSWGLACKNKPWCVFVLFPPA